MSDNAQSAKWDRIAGELKEKWGVVANDLSAYEKGEVQRIAGLLKEKKGLSDEESEREAERIMRNS
ncbi:hypothetical protein [Kushneria marisflavi]|uniref:Uncharacterized protein n=1 Tax=Kushneria marisflavi TaxID=157779 RepID=A0A240UMP6_9GAMM|nr:hypothetical protein [Kushneria marisflavi]ART62761.1 hypothetical protein B9H00_06595 [Kushneria marisflavi]RKD83830.1 hypothetical protein C8D96_2684 [Kushneria marisflavi]